MTEEDIKSEVRSVFSQAMGHDPLFPFRFLQATGSGTKTLTVPGVSTHFHWTSSEVAGLGSSIYVIADQDLVVPDSFGEGSDHDMDTDQEAKEESTKLSREHKSSATNPGTSTSGGGTSTSGGGTSTSGGGTITSGGGSLFFYDYLQECEDSPESTGVTPEDILVFVTGLHRPPATGWDMTPRIAFYSDSNRLPFASTCSLVLNISSGIDSYDKFKDKMCTAVLCGYGFGHV